MPTGVKNFFELKTNASGRASLDYLKSMERRAPAFQRAYNWALANDLYEMIKDGIPQGQKYGGLIKSLKLGEFTGQKDTSVFSVFVDSESKHLKKMDAQRMVIYVKRRVNPTKVKPEIEILINKGPWTAETIPFWPSKKDALIIQRKVDTRTAQKITKLQNGQRDDVRRDLARLNVKEVDQAVKQKMLGGRKAKAITDVAYEMISLEFGGMKTKASGLWRNSIHKLSGMQKSILSRYRRISQMLYDPRYKAFSGYPKVETKVKMSQLNAAKGFVRQIGK